MKVLTKDCPSCKKFNIEDDYSLTCSWGKRKKKKRLENPIGKAKDCNLKRGDE